MEYRDLFHKATCNEPFPYQIALAEQKWPEILHVPTGLGKTAGVLLAWLHKRKIADPDTPRRVLYCLPMRVLVEQVRDNSILFLHRLGLLAGKAVVIGEAGSEKVLSYEPSWGEPGKIPVCTLMGGEERIPWDRYPESQAILVGTQDMLLSRALNRGYGMSRYRWPIQFGLVNNDAIWFIDEPQLMGSGLATTAQLQGFREKLGNIGNTRTVWMSATMSTRWISTPDFDPVKRVKETISLTEQDRKQPQVRKRIEAPKELFKAKGSIDAPNVIAEEIRRKHNKGTRTLVVVNTVARAAALHAEIVKLKPKAEVVLVHSRFRPPDRKRVIDKLLAEPGEEGIIAISTQVVEAGVDVSSATMFTEVAPWVSLVQRFGRCNRFGEYPGAEVYWIDLPSDPKALEKYSPPYEISELQSARATLLELKEVGPYSLPSIDTPFVEGHVLRRKDLVELFDTTPDLSGHDIDISRFIRDGVEHDVLVFWRSLPKEGPADDEPSPERDELCAVPIAEIRDLLKGKPRVDCWVWDSLDSSWARVIDASAVYPGLTLMLRDSAGCYRPESGWDRKAKALVPPAISQSKEPAHGYDEDEWSEQSWQSIAEHTDQVSSEVKAVAESLQIGDRWKDTLLDAARWHDLGKAHPSFQGKIDPQFLAGAPAGPVAKAPKEAWRRDSLPGAMKPEDPRRKHFRHELVSGLAALMNGKEDLVAYLAAAHHGKVRLSIRSMPDEYRPPQTDTLFARGVWGGDEVPGVDLGNGVTAPAVKINLGLMELGEAIEGRSSWLAMALALRDRSDLGIFRLTFFEAILRAADERASAVRR